MIELYLSTDGKHTVHVSADTTKNMNALRDYAMKLYAEVLEQYGTKPQLWADAKNGHASAKSNGAVASEAKGTIPVCPDHHTPLRFRKGRYGDFWSCPTKLSDGTWCEHTLPAIGNDVRPNQA